VLWLIKKTNSEPACFVSEELHMYIQLFVITLSVIPLSFICIAIIIPLASFPCHSLTWLYDFYRLINKIKKIKMSLTSYKYCYIVHLYTRKNKTKWIGKNKTKSFWPIFRKLPIYQLCHVKQIDIIIINQLKNDLNVTKIIQFDRSRRNSDRSKLNSCVWLILHVHPKK